MFQHLLIPVDFTDKNRPALRVAEELAKQNAARVTLLHVVETLDDSEDSELEAFYRKLEGRARSKLGALEEELTAKTVQAGIALAFGKRSDEIVRYAEENDVDLIIMSSRKLSADEPIRPWPTISHRVALLSPRAVLLVR